MYSDRSLLTNQDVSSMGQQWIVYVTTRRHWR